MAKINLTESQLRNMISESVMKILNEDWWDNGSYEGQVSSKNAALDKQSAYNAQIATQNKYANQKAQLDREYVNGFVQKIQPIRIKLISFYNTLKNYQSKGFLGKFFSSNPKLSTFGLKKSDIYTLLTAYTKCPEALDSVSSKLRGVASFFQQVGASKMQE